MLLSLVSFGALLYLLFTFDDQPISKWTKFPLSLNAVVSILAGVSNACLAFIISMCLSQCKWNWVGRFVEPLIDFDRFDAASRGPWGSLRLLRSMTRRPHWISLGALTALLLLSYEPFLQAVITFEDRPVDLYSPKYTHVSKTGRKPVIGRTSRLDVGSWTPLKSTAPPPINFTGPDGKEWTIFRTVFSDSVRRDIGMAAAIWNGLSPLVSQQNLWPAFDCASPNCSWSPFPSLAVCSECVDISRHVRKTSGVTRVPKSSIPEGWKLDDGEALPKISNTDVYANQGKPIGVEFKFTKHEIPELGLNISNFNGNQTCVSGLDNNTCPDTHLTAKLTTNPGRTFSFRNLRTLLLAIQFMKADDSWKNNKTVWEETPITTQECGLYFCINEYESVLDQGVLREKILSSWVNKAPDSYLSDRHGTREYLQALNYTLDMGGGTVRLSDLQLYIPDEDFRSRSANSTQQKFNVTQATIISWLNIIKEGFMADCKSCANCTPEESPLIYPSLGCKRPAGMMIGLGESKSNVSVAIANVALSLTKWMRDRELESAHAVGEATIMIVITRVRWEYLTVPAATLVFGIVFAVLSIWETHRLQRPAWKDSTLATLAHAPVGDLRERLQVAAAAGDLAVLTLTFDQFTSFSLEMSQSTTGNTFQSIDALGEYHKEVFLRALSNLLSTDLAEHTYAEILDGLPTKDSLRESYLYLEGHPVYELNHSEICEGSLEKAREFRASLNPSSLRFEQHDTVAGTKHFHLRLIELVVVACHQIAAYLFELDDGAHKHKLHDDWLLQQLMESILQLGPGMPRRFVPPGAFFHLSYVFPEQYPRGLADVAGYWAEGKIFGGVIVFDRGETELECKAMWMDGARLRGPHTLYPPTPEQFDSLVRFLLSGPDEDVPCPLPIYGTRDNIPRWHPYHALAEYHIFRDKYERKLPPEPPKRGCTIVNADWPELRDEYIVVHQDFIRSTGGQLSDEEIDAARARLKEVTPSSPCWRPWANQG
ncbi:hypothetical protein FDECE_10757 [Fusarium decemcellulare]|nr:hypothetical protein FDECE_10757 [Fusarium decemcellulare]